MLSRPLLERLTITKYLLHAARDEYRAAGPFAAGRAILLLHDATEMLLRIAAEHRHASLKEQAAFSQVLDAVQEVAPGPMTHRSALNQLNKARVGFKHFGLLPTDEDAEKLLADTEAFFPEACRTLLDVDLATVSLRHLVEHRRTENWLAKAESALEAAAYQEAVQNAAIALAILLTHHRPEPPLTSLARLRLTGAPELNQVINAVEEEFRRQAVTIDLIVRGVDLRAYHRFQHLTPHVMLSMAGTFYIDTLETKARRRLSRTEALFCIRFVVDTALALRRSHIPERPLSHPSAAHRLRVLRATPVVVWPSDEPEVIRPAEVGEVFLAYASKPDQTGYFQVLCDGDRCFVAADAVTVAESD